MSAPEVGDRVRVHGEPYRGQYGHVADPTLVASAYLWDVWVCLEGGGGPRNQVATEIRGEPVSVRGQAAHLGDEGKHGRAEVTLRAGATHHQPRVTPSALA